MKLNFLYNIKAELISLRTSMTESQAKVTVMEKELKNTLLQLHAVQLQLHSNSNAENPIDSNVILNRLVSLFFIMLYRQLLL